MIRSAEAKVPSDLMRYWDMQKRLLVPFAIGLMIVVAAVIGIVYMQRGAHVELQGRILKVRTHTIDDASSVAVIDFRFVNPSEYPFVVRSVDIAMEDRAGKILDGATVSEVDAKNLFRYYPLLGEKFNDSLLTRDRIGPRQSMDRMVAVRFETPEKELRTRKKLTIRVEEIDGGISEIAEQK